MSKLIFIFFISLFALNNPVFGHSIQFEVIRYAPVVSVKASHSPSSPLAGVGVNVYAPGEDQPYQTGHTDRQGYFVFHPTTTGSWIFEIDDQHGHKKRTTISIDENFIKGVAKVQESREERKEDSPGITTKEEKSPATPTMEVGATFMADMPFVYKLILGLALIFGITGIYYGMSSRKSLKKRD